MKFAIELSESQLLLLRERAEAVSVSPEQLAQAAVEDILVAPDREFTDVAKELLARNAGLYRRLA